MEVPIVVQASPTITILCTDVESQGKITVTIEGDFSQLLPHLERMIRDCLTEMNN